MVRRSILWCFFAAVLIFNCCCLHSAASEAIDQGICYVSTQGSDNNPGTESAPVRTLEKAKEIARKVLSQQSPDGSGGMVIVIRGGRYYMESPLVMSEVDFPANRHKLTIKAYPGEEPVVVGGIRVTGWEKYKSRIYRARVPSIINAKSGNVSLLENGTVGTLARTPNEGWIKMERPLTNRAWSFCYREGDADLTGWDTRQLQVYMIQMGTYFSTHVAVASVDVKERRLYTKFKMWDPFYSPVPGKSFVLENALEMLDTPGEFYADSSSGYLYYMPRSRDIAKAVVEVSTVDNIIRFAGSSPEKMVGGITVEGICFESSNPLPPTGDWPKASYGQISFENAGNILIKDCRMLNPGWNGISMTGACDHISITGCEIADCGSDAIKIVGNYKKQGAGKALVLNHDNLIHNNYIHHIGRLDTAAGGIRMNTSGCAYTISNNLITDIRGSGVLLFSEWDLPREMAVMNDNVIKNNDFARCVGSAWDQGAFYIGATTDNTAFENNRIADVWSWLVATWPQPENRPTDQCSIDFDPGSKGAFNTYIRNNTFYGESAIVVEFGDPNTESIFTNNYFELPERIPGEPSDTTVNRYYSKYQEFGWRMYTPGWMTNSVYESYKTFDTSKVSKDIGLTSEFHYPYPKEAARPVTYPMECGFEGTTSPLFLYKYSDGPSGDLFSSTRVHDGRQSFRIDKDVSVLRYHSPEFLSNKKVKVWFYDDPSRKQSVCLLTLRGPGALEGSVAAVGVDSSISEDHYILREWDHQVHAVDRKRTRGWHELVMDVKDADGCTITIDGQNVGWAPLMKSFTIVDIGDPDFGSDSKDLCFDSLRIEAP